MKRVAALLSVLVAMVPAAPVAANPDIDARIRALERNVEALKRKIAKDLKMYYADKARITDEGVTLVDEMNNLRRENHRQNLKQEAVRAAANESGGDPALASHILNLESKAKILEDMLAAANGAQPELQQ